MKLRMCCAVNARGLMAGVVGGVLASALLVAQSSAPALRPTDERAAQGRAEVGRRTAAEPGRSTVADAAMGGDRVAVKTLLQQGIDVNAAQGDGMTALHWAAMKNDAELAQMLVYAGANVKATTRLGANTPLVMAARNGNAPVVRVLLKAGADAKAATSTGTTALMLAAASGNADAVKALLAAGADIEAKESSMQQTPLMFAAAFSRVEAMKALVAAGANVKATTKVVNLASLTSPEEEFFRQQQQPAPAASGAPAAAAARPAGAPASMA